MPLLEEEEYEASKSEFALVSDSRVLWHVISPSLGKPAQSIHSRSAVAWVKLLKLSWLSSCEALADARSKQRAMRTAERSEPLRNNFIKVVFHFGCCPQCGGASVLSGKC